MILAENLQNPWKNPNIENEVKIKYYLCDTEVYYDINWKFAKPVEEPKYWKQSEN